MQMGEPSGDPAPPTSTQTDLEFLAAATGLQPVPPAPAAAKDTATPAAAPPANGAAQSGPSKPLVMPPKPRKQRAARPDHAERKSAKKGMENTTKKTGAPCASLCSHPLLCP